MCLCSEDEAYKAAKKYTRIIQKLDIPVRSLLNEKAATATCK